MIEVVLNDRLGKKVRVKCNPDDTIGDLKKLAAAQLGTRPEKLRIQKWYTVYKDHITLADYEIGEGMGLELWVYAFVILRFNITRVHLLCVMHLLYAGITIRVQPDVVGDFAVDIRIRLALGTY